MELRGDPIPAARAPRAGQAAAELPAADLAAELAAAVTACHARGWCQGTAGNFSIVQRREPLALLITPSGIDKGCVCAGDLLAVDCEGRLMGEPLDSRTARPSAETLLHCAIVQTLAAGAVLHTHSVASTLLGEHFLEQGGFRIRNYEMLKGLRGIATHATEAYVPVLANSQDMEELAARVRALAAAVPDMHGFLLTGHGLYTWGEDLAEARRHLEIFEFLFEVVARRTQFSPFSGV